MVLKLNSLCFLINVTTLNLLHAFGTKDLLLLATTKSVKHITTRTELVAVCHVCKSKVLVATVTHAIL